MASSDQTSEMELGDYLRIVRHRRFVVVLCALVVLLSAGVATFLQAHVYQASATLLLEPKSSETIFDPNTGRPNDPARAVQTELQVILSRPVRDEVRRQLGVAPSISAVPVSGTDVVNVKAESTVPANAAAIANAYANAYIDVKRSQAVNDLLAAATQIQAKISDLQSQIDVVQAQIVAAPTSSKVGGTDLQSQLTSLVDQQSLFKQKLDQTQVGAGLKSGGAQLVTPATLPTSPIRPSPKRALILALVVGVVFGLGVAIVVDYLDDSIASEDDLSRAAPELQTLGLIPFVPGWRERKEPHVLVTEEPKSLVAEAYRTLRTSIQFINLENPARIIQVTSPSAAEGKTTTLANLGVIMANAGKRVCVLCCDLRRPRIHEFFGLPNTVGITSVLVGDAPLSAALQQVVGVERLHLLASGPLPPNPSELLLSARAAELLLTLRREFDLVLIDCPPLLPVTDAAVLSSRVDGTLIVVTAGSTTKREFKRAVSTLRQVDAPVLGVVLNGVGKGPRRYGYRTYGYGYGYGYGYHQQSASPEIAGSAGSNEKVVVSDEFVG